MRIPPPGDYVAKLNGRIVAYEAKSGAFCLSLPCTITQGEHTSFTTKANVTLVKKDGKLMDSSIDNMKSIFNWDGFDPCELQDHDYTGIEFALNQCTHEDYEGRPQFKVGWVNPLGGGGMAMPDPADRKSIIAKHGAKFRALASATKTPTKAPTKPASAPAAPAAPSGPPAKPIAPSTKQEAWDEFCKDHEGKTDAAITDLWFAELKKTFPGRDQDTLTPAEWGRLKSGFGVPF